MRQVKVLHLCTTDGTGGAARAAYRIHRAQVEAGMPSEFFAQKKSSNDPTVCSPPKHTQKLMAILRPHMERWPVTGIFSGRGTLCSMNWVPGTLAYRKKIEEADVINLHFIGEGLLPLNLRPIKHKKIVWTLHDMWAFCGVEHYAPEGKDALWRTGQITSKDRFDRINHWVLHRKKHAWRDLDITVICPSRWLARCARESFLFRDRRIEVIPYPIDLNVYHPINKKEARRILGLDPDKRYLLFGADPISFGHSRKGGDLLAGALRHVGNVSGDTEIIEFGSRKDTSIIEGFVCHCLGSFRDDLSLAIIYSAADCFVAPSRQDNLPNTVVEALACNTPVVAFNIGGMPDMIQDEATGYLAEPFSVESMAAGLRKFLEAPFSTAPREQAVRLFAPPIITDAYADLYSAVARPPQAQASAVRPVHSALDGRVSKCPQ